MSAVLLPTVPGYVRGIVAVDPITVQCHDCGVTRECPPPAGMILARFIFHQHGEVDPPRRCPACFTAATADCGRCRRERR